MPGIAHFLRGIPINGKNTPRNMRNILIALVLAFSLRSTGHNTEVQAAPAKQEDTPVSIRYYLQIQGLPKRFCVGQAHSVQVTPLVEMTGTFPSDGKQFDWKDRIITGVMIATDGYDKSILSVDPAKQYSGKGLPSNLVTTNPYKGGAENYGEVTFTIKGLKPGTTSLYFTAKVPERFSTGSNQVFGPESLYPPGGLLDVVYCKYKVSMTFRRSLALGGGISGLLEGYLTPTEISVGEQSTSGTNTFSFGEAWTLPAPCRASVNAYSSETVVWGRHLENEQLELNFTYNSVTHSVKDRCAGASYSDSRSIDLDQMLIKKVQIPATGGTFGIPGSGLILIVEPVVEGGQ